MSPRVVDGLGPSERQVLLALADDEHMMGQRHTEWIGVAPFIEEDLAFASIGQDELGHAAMLYELLDDDTDGLALRRDPADYRSSWLAEAECTDWADALIRHWLYDEAEVLRWQALATSTVEEVRAIAARALLEEVYHRRHAHALLDALATDADAAARLRRSFAALYPLGVGLFDACPDQRDADPAVVGEHLPQLLTRWEAAVTSRFAAPTPDITPPRHAGRTLRGPEFAETYARMQEVLMLDPTARW